MPKMNSLRTPSYRRSQSRSVVGFPTASRALLTLAFGAFAACSDGSNTGTDPNNPNNPDGGSSADLSLPPNPPPGKVRVNVATSGTGSGTVTSQPAGIACGATCSVDFDVDTQITFLAQGTGAVFSGWGGACAGQGGACTLTLKADTNITATFDTQSCTPDGICWEAPLPFGFDLRDVWAIAPDDVWAVGNGGSIVHYDGQAWTRKNSGTTQDLEGVWARSKSEIWVAAGANGLMLKGDGNTFTPMRVSTTEARRTTSVWGTADRMFVGIYGPNVYRYDGTTFMMQSLPIRATAQVLGVTGSSNANVWAYGSENALARTTNGTNWTAVEVATYNGLWATSNTEAYLVTVDGKFKRSTNGVTPASLASLPVLNSISSLWGTAANSLFTSGPVGMFFRWDGTKWNSHDAGVPTYGFGRVHGTSATDVWGVGLRGVIAHFDGTNASSKRNNVFSGDIIGSWGSSPRDMWFVTDANSVIHYDGATYTETKQFIPGAGSGVDSVGGSGPNDVWVGGHGAGGTPVMNHYDGTSWTKSTLSQAINIIAVNIDHIHAIDNKTAFATGSGSQYVMKFDGTSWSLDAKFLPGILNGVWGAQPSDLWALSGNQVFHFDGSGWTADNRVTAISTYSIHGSSANDIWVGIDKAAWHYNGSTWIKLDLPNAVSAISSVVAVSPTDAWFVDSVGNVFRWNGTTATKVDTSIGGSMAKFYGWAADAKNVFFGGRGILSYRK